LARVAKGASPFVLSRDKGTVELTGFYFLQEHRFIIGIGGGSRSPLRWSRDYTLSEEVKELLMEGGMKRLN
jgi:hypothetical protein